MKLRRRGNPCFAGSRGTDFQLSADISGAQARSLAALYDTAEAVPFSKQTWHLPSFNRRPFNTQSSSETQLAEIVVADLNALKRRLRLVVFDDVMLDAGLV